MAGRKQRTTRIKLDEVASVVHERHSVREQQRRVRRPCPCAGAKLEQTFHEIEEGREMEEGVKRSGEGNGNVVVEFCILQKILREYLVPLSPRRAASCSSSRAPRVWR